MQERDLSLTPRKEELRNARPIVIPIQFSLTEIKQHFENSLEAIKKQYEVADSLNNSGDVDGCKIIWRSQVVLAEGLLDFYIHEMSKFCLFRMFTGEWASSENTPHLRSQWGKLRKHSLLLNPKIGFSPI